eukprot:scaffold298_cov247-Pinguiococcus_pyrenoidosus.AAC.38
MNSGASDEASATSAAPPLSPETRKRTTEEAAVRAVPTPQGARSMAAQGTLTEEGLFNLKKRIRDAQGTAVLRKQGIILPYFGGLYEPQPQGIVARWSSSTRTSSTAALISVLVLAARSPL